MELQAVGFGIVPKNKESIDEVRGGVFPASAESLS